MILAGVSERKKKNGAWFQTWADSMTTFSWPAWRGDVTLAYGWGDAPSGDEVEGGSRGSRFCSHSRTERHTQNPDLSSERHTEQTLGQIAQDKCWLKLSNASSPAAAAAASTGCAENNEKRSQLLWDLRKLHRHVLHIKRDGSSRGDSQFEVVRHQSLIFTSREVSDCG